MSAVAAKTRAELRQILASDEDFERLRGGISRNIDLVYGFADFDCEDGWIAKVIRREGRDDLLAVTVEELDWAFDTDELMQQALRRWHGLGVVLSLRLKRVRVLEERLHAFYFRLDVFELGEPTFPFLRPEMYEHEELDS